MRVLENGIAIIETDQYACRWIAETGRLCYDPRVESVMKPLINPGDVVVDCGAYVGGYAGMFKQFVGDKGRVYAFETNPAAFECLKHNCPDVDCCNIALGSGLEHCNLVVDEENCGQTHVHCGPEGNLSTALDGFFFNRYPDFIKLDVEGMEPNVILGARNIINAASPIIFCEINRMALGRAGWSPATLIEMMNCLGYRLQFLHPSHHLGMPLLDVLFVPKDDKREWPVCDMESR